MLKEPLPFFPEDPDDNQDDNQDEADCHDEMDCDDDGDDNGELFNTFECDSEYAAGDDEGDGDDDEESAATATPNKKPPLPYKNEISHVLNRNPQLAINNRVIGAIDAGIRFPIALATKARGDSNFKTYQVRKTNLYQYENEECRMLELKKSERADVLEAERRLGSTGTKHSYSLDKFVNGYFKDWLATYQLLFQFYGQAPILNMRYHKMWARKKLYDAHSTTILEMLGLRPDSKIETPGEVILIVEDTKIEVKHTKRRPSKHAAFWRYFLRKVMSRQ